MRVELERRAEANARSLTAEAEILLEQALRTGEALGTPWLRAMDVLAAFLQTERVMRMANPAEAAPLDDPSAYTARHDACDRVARRRCASRNGHRRGAGGCSQRARRRPGRPSNERARHESADAATTAGKSGIRSRRARPRPKRSGARSATPRRRLRVLLRLVDEGASKAPTRESLNAWLDALARRIRRRLRRLLRTSATCRDCHQDDRPGDRGRAAREAHARQDRRVLHRARYERPKGRQAGRPVASHSAPCAPAA
jgi:hypothetical protein